MPPLESLRVGYVLKRYPRYSETFIVNEVLAHEAVGLPIEIFSLRAPKDTHFQDGIARVRAPVHYLYLPAEDLTAEEVRARLLDAASFWRVVRDCSKVLPNLWPGLEAAQAEQVPDVYQALLLAREARRRGILHLHAHFATTATTVARLAARFARIPYTLTAHANDIFNDSIRPDELRRNLADAAAVVTVSDYNVQYLCDHCGAEATRLRRIYNGLDLERFAWQSPQDRPRRIVAVGRLIEKKGFGDLIEACAILAKRDGQFRCQIIGAGLLEAELRAQIDRLGLQAMVDLLGPRPQFETLKTVQTAGVLAAPCVVGKDGNRDGLPTVLLEAMGLGTPCVSTDVTGIPEVVRDGETGLMVRQRDPAALATALERLLADAPLRVRLAGGARRLIEAKFDIRRNSDRLRTVFREAVQAGNEASQEVS